MSGTFAKLQGLNDVVFGSMCKVGFELISENALDASSLMYVGFG